MRRRAEWGDRMSERRREVRGPRGERVTLDQLFADSEQHVTDLERPRRRWLRDGLFALGLAAAIYVVIRVFGFVVPYPVLAGTALACLLLRRALQAVPVGEPPVAMYSPVWGVDDGVRFAPADGLVRAVQRWEARFGWTDRDHVRYSAAVRPRLQELVDERLRQRHGITVRTDPTSARALLGDKLWTFLYGAVERSPTPRELAVIVAEMEKL
jgi:hypothetical protein